ncbi:MAG: lipocalin family protein [Porphyromonas sp.]|nr:lipocalin family protein [Porphyromonas sp.]
MKTGTKVAITLAATALGYMAYREWGRVKPARAYPVDSFEAERFVGSWLVVAGTPQWASALKENMSYDFSILPDGSMQVVKSYYESDKDLWHRSAGHVLFRHSTSRGALRVSFCGPFYRGYNIVAIDEAYSVALVVGRTPAEAMILSRTPDVPEEIMNKYVSLAKYIGVKMGAFTCLV